MTSPRGSMIRRRNVLCVFTTGPCPDQLLPPCVSYSSGHGPVVDPSDTIAMMGGEEGEGGAKTFFCDIYVHVYSLRAGDVPRNSPRQHDEKMTPQARTRNLRRNLRGMFFFQGVLQRSHVRIAQSDRRRPPKKKYV